MESQLLRIDVFTGASGFERLKPQWATLALAQGTHFLHFPGWYEAQLRNQEDTNHIFFVALFQQDTLVAVLPMEHTRLEKKSVKVPIMQIYYDNEMGVNDVVSSIALAPHLATITKALKSSAPYFLFIRWACIGNFAHANSLLQGSTYKRHTHNSKYIAFTEGADAFLDGYSSKFRKNLRKKISKAEQQGTLALECCKTLKQLQSGFEQFLIVEDSGWKGREGTSIRQQPQKLAYYQTLLREYGGSGHCQINLLYLNEQVIAGQFSVIAGDTLYLLKIGYLEECAELSPGYLILARLVEALCAHSHIRKISFVTGVDWIDRWHPKIEPVGIFYTSNGSMMGRFLMTAANRYLSLKKQARFR